MNYIMNNMYVKTSDKNKTADILYGIYLHFCEMIFHNYKHCSINNESALV